MDLELFLGRFHPLIVHLPIGFILLAGILEGLRLFRSKQFHMLEVAIKIALIATFLGAVGSIILGFLLASGGGYDQETLNWHQWMGIGVAVTSLLAWILKRSRFGSSKKPASVLIFITVIGVSITGHFGGNLTHGSDYLLVHAPDFIKKISSKAASNASQDVRIPSSPDSIVLFAHLVKPVLERKCYACHNPSKSNGGLLLTTMEGIQKGGDTGPSIVGGKSRESLLFVRSTLPQNNPKFMPPKGTPLTYSELKVIQWWIDSGASFEATVKNMDATKEIKDLLFRDFAIDLSPKSYVEQVKIDPIGEEVLIDLRQSGWNVRPVSSTIHLLEVSGGRKPLNDAMITALTAAKSHITRLDLSQMGLMNHQFDLSNMPHLTQLKLNENAITGEALRYLRNARHLEVLNLFGTQVGDEGLEHLSSIQSLKRLYFMNTPISENGIKSLREKLPGLSAIR
ncbi:MAG: c-type cytochrome domain-containing protein [Bacteroidota bacterium]